MNNMCAVGNLVADAKVNEGKTVASFTLGVSRPFKNKEGKYDSDFIKCKLFGENVVKAFEAQLVKGATFEITGAFRNENYEKDGQKIYDYSIAVERLRRIGGNKAANTDTPASEPATEPADNGFASMAGADDAGLPWA